jgi:VIT1/CCC1 family predicted Fe2+/Mn2+ transporter
MLQMGHKERHRSSRAGWLRAAVLGSNDAIVSTASLMVGVAASNASREAIFVAGVAGLVAGAMSMAAGEYVSVCSQRDIEKADIAKEKRELAEQPEKELAELTEIYVERGLTRELAHEVAKQLSKTDRLKAHLRDELSIELDNHVNPLQAAWVSALSFSLFATIPVLFLLAAPADYRIFVIVGSSISCLGLLGAFGAYLGGAPYMPAILRVTLGGGLAMGITAGIGKILGVSIS